MMLSFLRNMKNKFMFGVAFVLFFTTPDACDGGSYNIDVLIETCAERIFMRICLTFGFFLFKS